MKFGIKSNWFDGKFDVIFICCQVIEFYFWLEKSCDTYMKPVLVFLETNKTFFLQDRKLKFAESVFMKAHRAQSR